MGLRLDNFAIRVTPANNCRILQFGRDDNYRKVSRWRNRDCNSCEQLYAQFAPTVLNVIFISSIICTFFFLQRSEVVPFSPTAAVDDAGTVKSMAGRQSRFATEEDLVIVRDVAATSAHLAAFGETRGIFQEAAGKVNANATMHEKVSWKSVCDRYKRIQDQFDRRGSCERRMSGMRGAVGELNELWMHMRQAWDDVLATKAAEKTAQRERDEEKDRIGKALVASATKRKQTDSGSTTEGEDGPTPKKAKSKSARATPSMDMAAFSLNLRDADLARIDLERERLNFERERSEADRAEREREREERREEREKMQELELAKYKLLIEALNKK